MNLPRPSSLPALAECACFASQPSEWTESGTDRHAALSALWKGDDSLLWDLTEEEQDAVKWAVEYIKVHAAYNDHPIDFEKPLTYTNDNGEVQNGTPDAACSHDVFDLKWRHRDYLPQMASYALMRMQALGLDWVRVHLLFGVNKKAVVYRLTADEAKSAIQVVLDRASDPNKRPEPCDYCSWCKNQVTCPAFEDRAKAINAGREDWTLENYHASQIDDPAEMAKALNLASEVEKWAKAVKHHAKELAKSGVKIPGWILKDGFGDRYIEDIPGAYAASGLKSEWFLKCCKLSLTKLEEMKAEVDFTTKAEGKREVERLLKDYIKRDPEQTLTKEKKDKK